MTFEQTAVHALVNKIVLDDFAQRKEQEGNGTFLNRKIYTFFIHTYANTHAHLEYHIPRA